MFDEMLRSEEFLGESRIQTIFKIHCFSGKRLCEHSFCEREVLFMPGCSFQVMSSTTNSTGEQHIIEIKETSGTWNTTDWVS